jgi:hypothetical protein
MILQFCCCNKERVAATRNMIPQTLLQLQSSPKFSQHGQDVAAKLTADSLDLLPGKMLSKV